MNAMHSSDEQIVDYVMGSLVGEDAARLEAHATSCAECAEKLQAEAMLEEQLFAVGKSAKNVVPKETPVQWRPAAAAALRNLVDEPVAAPAPATPAPPPVVNEVEWQYPVAKKKQSAPRWPWVVLAASVATFALAAGLVIGMSQTKQPQPVTPVPPPVAQAPAAPTPKTEVIPVVEGPKESGAVAALGAPSSAVQETARSPKGKGKSKEKELLAAAEPAKKDSDNGKKDGFDELLAGKKPAEPPKEKLTRDDVLRTVTANKASILKCANAYASSGGTLPPKLMVKWTIKASGFVENIEMASPELKGTQVDACVVAAVKKWRFPEFRSGDIPVTFPFALAQ